MTAQIIPSEPFLFKACIFLWFMPSVWFGSSNVPRRKKLTWEPFCEVHQHLHMHNSCLRQAEKTFLRTCSFLQLHKRVWTLDMANKHDNSDLAMQAGCAGYLQTSWLPQGELCIFGVLLQCGPEADVLLEWVPSSLGSAEKTNQSSHKDLD